MKWITWLWVEIIKAQETPCPIKMDTKIIYAIDECAIRSGAWQLQLDITKECKYT